ncbi:transcription factor, RsfA family [Alicyclobacillus acidocaldarius subsp. acidocaldarius Tc-4-1]|uniref:Transcription factor, RsfA family n=2 Tax=Alicyclobacillus acidocaldarius TaxID=405212 RepID=F8IGW5_ALIAT|nr:RsfA family transcriptional regulator [Alicyclobacillus acidocaldarius]AEJ43130.1 transcription factor, RsfA family [Alicyclobacillus acidocaldarius subsp. acidocaldarius Tc-4-1]
MSETRQKDRAMRQDAWTTEDDEILAEIVLKHIKQGSTQLAGFNEAARRLGRTAAACGFRWNACVRKQQRYRIELAKEERKKNKSQRVQAQLEGGDADHPTATLMTWAQVLRFLRQEKNTAQEWASRWRSAERQLNEWKAKYEALEVDYKRVSEELRELKSTHDAITRDYKALMEIMERARKAALLDDDLIGPKFAEGFMYRIDEYGNLERITTGERMEQAE